ncbi:NAD(P)H oxidoreductase [Salipaludibacillus agaradhaerens]|uniref:NAD(P)H oxidoreductase n=1 Tax=Salipaludibacillus agaradhaerens TaxID=76935 RepID=UPI002151F293|nr:NAD(P)H oxidoreductase [Salipaludibacillus agaradhaerens]MCR6105634.1 NAD(P)H oxidoreductase [Salipaludibacillus agaradhaerens]MCR6117671.1 NAD(P)H oxidoreductase [Salipaludibacillus agaradhaerens]
MNVLTVVTHPRIESLTFSMANHLMKGIKDNGHHTDMLDLYRLGFNPVLGIEDEPEWTAKSQVFSAEVHKEMQRLEQYDALAFVFPLWWWSMPALMKGYIDRVWNYHFAYGSGQLPHKRVLWLSLAGAPIERFEKRKYDTMIKHYFNVGLADYCGIPISKFELFYETVKPTPQHVQKWQARSYELGNTFFTNLETLGAVNK